jgi:hypothetical protein
MKSSKSGFFKDDEYSSLTTGRGKPVYAIQHNQSSRSRNRRICHEAVLHIHIDKIKLIALCEGESDHRQSF